MCLCICLFVNLYLFFWHLQQWSLLCYAPPCCVICLCLCVFVYDKYVCVVEFVFVFLHLLCMLSQPCYAPPCCVICATSVIHLHTLTRHHFMQSHRENVSLTILIKGFKILPFLYLDKFLIAMQAYQYLQGE